MHLTCLINYVHHIIGYQSNDKDLVDRVLSGDTRVFETVIKNTENLVTRIIFKMIPVSEDRKDVVQDVYLKAYNNLQGFKFRSKLSTWIAQITYNTCLSWIEKKKYSLPGNFSEDEMHNGSTYPIIHGSSPGNESENRIYHKELSIILKKEIDGLPVIYQTLITLYHHESLSYEELSQITDLPTGTIKSYLFRARKMLKEKLLSKYKKETL
ncbi:MAG TPA: RNA polymerase sigma factor [Puia sp.]|nr:RNA polymerase sigma factor [Puia sp.]